MRRQSSILLTLLLTLGCGDPSGDVASGGIGGSGISSGAISGFGSIFVTGTEWDVGLATITFDGAPATESDLSLGMVVTVEGTLDASGLSGTATRVRFDDDVEGPISQITTVGNDELELVVLGVRVLVTDAVTVFDDSFPGFDFSSIAVGDVVEVSGFVDGSGAVRATRVEKQGIVAIGVTRVELEGTVSGFSGGSSFLLGTVTVNFDPTGVATDLSDLPGGPMNGQRVEVKGVLSAPDTIEADEIEAEDDDLPDTDDAELEGIISSFVSLASFSVNGQQVDASSATLSPTDPSLYRNGVLVEVEGSIVAGVLVAQELELRGFDVRVSAEVVSDTDVDVAAGTVRLLGITIRIDASTQIEDERDDVDPFTLADVRGGDYLEVRGIEDPAGGIRATRFERDDPDDVELRGFVEAVDPPPGSSSITILGVVVPTDGSTEFEGLTGGLDEAQFYSMVQPGDLVEAKDEVGPRTMIDVADEVEFEAPEGGSGALPRPSISVVAAPSPSRSGSAAPRSFAGVSAGASIAASIAAPGDLESQSDGSSSSDTASTRSEETHEDDTLSWADLLVHTLARLAERAEQESGAP